MKASELVKNLQECIEKYGDLDVCVYAEHEQSQLVCDSAVKQVLEDNPEITVIEVYGDRYF